MGGRPALLYRIRVTLFAAFASSASVFAAFSLIYVLSPRAPLDRHDILPPAASNNEAVGTGGMSIAANYTPPRRALDVNVRPSAPVRTDTAVPIPGADVDKPGEERRGITILQIGDSHTAADFLTGELRRRLQQRYGNGGPGYIIAGKPHIGVRSSALKVSASAGWTYRAIQKSDTVAEFWLSGFNAVATAPGETLAFTSDAPVVFDSIEIEGLRAPGSGSFDISLDGTVKASYDFNAETAEPVVLRLSPEDLKTDQIHRFEIKTSGQGPVSIASVAFYNKQSGLSYSSIGYPGATIDLLNKFDQSLMADDLRRLDPQIIVLAFGTNEAAKKNLDVAQYERNYEKVIDKIKAVLPNVEIVLVGPPDGAERGANCAKKSATAVCRPHPAEAEAKSDCDWHPLPKLEAVRNVARRIAERRGFSFWNWASIMPEKCGAQQWVSASPALMTPDHIHFTVAGYNRSADEFLNTLIPVVDKVQSRTSLASRN
jgi:lysophospholipase L1-like esterase